tara:strand:+ start:610 stop:735 length:126 start_codon:yes stop_codon:yes gene_type:complete
MEKLIDWRFLLTPYATTIWRVKNVDRKRYYIFGFKIMDIAI